VHAPVVELPTLPPWPMPLLLLLWLWLVLGAPPEPGSPLVLPPPWPPRSVTVPPQATGPTTASAASPRRSLSIIRRFIAAVRRGRYS
jgi:hypothetical protein